MACELLLCALLVAVPSAAPPKKPRAQPDTWAALERELPDSSVARAEQLMRFAHDDLPAVPDRLRALRAARALKARDGAGLIELHELEAELQGALGDTRARRAALRAARDAAARARLDKRARRLSGLLRSEDALVLLVRAVQTADVRGRSVDPRATEEVRRALPEWLAIGDERTHGVARMWIARAVLIEKVKESEKLGSEKPERDERAARVTQIATELADIVDALGTVRLHAHARAEVLRSRAALLEDAGQLSDAARDRLAADRESDVDLRVSGLAPSARAPYVRSKETAALCKKVRAEKASCAREEQTRWGSATHYDFSRERSSAFDAQRADDVFADYEPAVQACLKQGAKDNLTSNTHVELEWAVGNDGRVKSVDVRPMRLRGTSVDTCLQTAFALFRYPRYGGEMQHVRLDFNVGG